MKKKLSKGIMHPMLLDYLLTFGTSWQDEFDIFDFRIRHAKDALQASLLRGLGYEVYSKRSAFMQAIDFGFIEHRMYPLIPQTNREYLKVNQYRLSQKGLRRIARG